MRRRSRFRWPSSWPLPCSVRLLPAALKDRNREHSFS